MVFENFIWQDVVLTGGAFVFSALLIPTLRDPSAEVPRTTSIPTAIMLVIFSATFFTLDLRVSSVANLFTAAAWMLIAA